MRSVTAVQKPRIVVLGMLLTGWWLGGCSEGGGGPSNATAGAAATTGGAAASAGSAGSPAAGGSGAGTAGSSTAMGGSQAGNAGSAGASSDAGGPSAGSGGATGTGGGGAGGGSGTGGGAGAPNAAMCKTAIGALPTFQRVAASDKPIPGAVGVVGNPEASNVIYVPQHFTGDVRVVQDGKLLSDPLLHVDVRQDPPGREQGLLSIVLSPDFAKNHLMYVYYSAATPQGRSTVDEFELTSATQAKFVRRVYAQEHSHKWHNGGTLQFGPDKWLYVSVGDNQDDCGPSCAQQAEGPYGRIRKIDVSVMDPNGTAKTFNNGLRNPWRWSFDPLTYDLVVGDVGDGSDTSEKLFFAPKASSEGRNWGWAPDTRDNRKPEGTIATLKNAGGAIIGGRIYRGSNPKMAGACGVIFYGHLNGEVYTINNDGSQNKQQDALSGIKDFASFGVDASGELYTTYIGGQVFRIEAK